MLPSHVCMHNPFVFLKSSEDCCFPQQIGIAFVISRKNFFFKTKIRLLHASFVVNVSKIIQYCMKDISRCQNMLCLLIWSWDEAIISACLQHHEKPTFFVYIDNLRLQIIKLLRKLFLFTQILSSTRKTPLIFMFCWAALSVPF